MPITEKDYAVRGPAEDAIYQELVAELTNPRVNGQPMVEVRQMARGLRHVHVIWDRWDECDPVFRAAIVRDAFRQVKGPEFEKSIAITVPATVPEAGENGMLPFVVRPFRWHRLDAAARDEARDALLREGASVLEGETVPPLRFATREQAEEAVARLKHAAPRFEWTVTETRFVPG